MPDPNTGSAFDTLTAASRALLDGDHNWALAAVIAVVVALFVLAIRREANLTRSGTRRSGAPGFRLNVAPRFAELNKLKREQGTAEAVTQALLARAQLDKDSAPVVRDAVDRSLRSAAGGVVNIRNSGDKVGD
jgi:hypothetical protein